MLFGLVVLGIALSGAHLRYGLARTLGPRLVEYGGQMAIANMEASEGFLAALNGQPAGLRGALGRYRRSGYPLVLALSRKLGPATQLPHPVVLTQIVCAAAASVLLGLWAARRVGAAAGLFLAASIAWWPPFVLHTLPTMPEALLIPIWSGLVVLHDRAFTKPSARWFALLGGFGGLAALIRPELLLVPIYIFSCSLAMDWPWRKRAAIVAIMLVAFALLLSVEIVATRTTTGLWRPLPSGGSFTVWQGFGEIYNAAGVWVADTEVAEWLRSLGTTRTSPEGIDLLRRDHQAHIREYPLTFALGVADRALKVLVHPYVPITLDPSGRFRAALTSWPLLLFGASAVAWLLTPLGKRLRWTIALPLAYTMLALGISHYEPRYAVGGALTLFLIVAAALSRVVAPWLVAAGAWVRTRRRPEAGQALATSGRLTHYWTESRRTFYPRLLAAMGLLSLFLFAVAARGALVRAARAYVQTLRVADASRIETLRVWEPLAKKCAMTDGSLPADCSFARDRFGIAGPPLRTAKLQLEPGAYALLLRIRVIVGAAAMRMYAHNDTGEVHAIHNLYFPRPGVWTAYAPVVVRGTRTFSLEFYPMYSGQPYLIDRATLRWRNLLFLLGDRGGAPPAPPAERLTGPQHIRLERAWILALDSSPVVPVAIREEPGEPIPVWAATDPSSG